MLRLLKLAKKHLFPGARGNEERQFITKEFADTIAGKAPLPYFRLHDPVQKALVEQAALKRDD